MTVTPVPVLMREGAAIPRLDLTDPSEAAWRPTPVEKIPPGSHVLFISHRWLRPGQPDDEEGTKLRCGRSAGQGAECRPFLTAIGDAANNNCCSAARRQILAAARSFAEESGCKPEDVFIWNDFSCVDQSAPQAGVQALPLYQAACDAFVRVDHPQYFQRAWCRTEAYLQARLGCCAVTHRLPVGEERVQREPPHEGRRNFDDPALGLLFAEADRAALAVLTGLFREMRQPTAKKKR